MDAAATRIFPASRSGYHAKEAHGLARDARALLVTTPRQPLAHDVQPMIDIMALLDSIKHTFMAEKITNLTELFVEQLQDLYSAETQLVEALPKMEKAAFAKPLKAGFKSHLAQTKEHAKRLERILKKLGAETGGKTCRAMQGLIQEGSEMIHEDALPEVKDAGLIAAAQRVEHYEIAGYGTVRTFAQLMGERDIAATLGLTLKEEAETDKKLTAAAKTLNLKALMPTKDGDEAKSRRK